ncbi:TPA: hypothetical protein JBF32_14310 [Legionella pneumophila]|uniref:hypothetical protein n=1 Tax=Legionella pneumophila TaxID=446 RepID=UPI001A2211AC|nr:hypothetical protein [Legionella pneumophila]HAT9099622.1 hypothetical protein [Legionella pneumophila subsp. pneumophila]MDW8914951.1 hypothetical protein [Legionella pneumophila]MDW9078391.1 hypothetical protein [Legionella pneumophila]MDW9084373.1 hypothetical protein [Legionella pneumophila]
MLVTSYKKAIAGIIIFHISTSCYPDSDKYLCIEKHSVGFKYTTKSNDWENANFTRDEYIISKCNSSDQQSFLTYDCKYKFTKVGDTQPSGKCSYYPKISIICEPYLAKLKINLKNGRFIYVYSEGYWNSNFESDTPYMAIGICTPF